jgi:hypothetical protein
MHDQNIANGFQAESPKEIKILVQDRNIFEEGSQPVEGNHNHLFAKNTSEPR